MLTALRAVRRSDSGMTLIELLVGAGLMVIIGGMSAMFFVSAGRQTNRTANESFATAQARVAITAVTTALQVADTPTNQAGYAIGRFATTTPSTLVFYTNTNANRVGSDARSAPTMISFAAAGGQLVEQVYAPIAPYPSDYTTNYPATPTTSRVIVSKLGNTDVFTYCTGQTDPASSCTAATDPTTIASVGVKLVLTGLPGETAQTLQSTIAITGAVS